MLAGQSTMLDMELESAATIVFRLHIESGEGIPCIAQVRMAIAESATGKATSARVTTDARGVGHFRSILPGEATFYVRLEWRPFFALRCPN